MPETTVMIEAAAVRKEYKAGKVIVPALQSATFQIMAGEHVALVGPSGSGKSTLLNLLGGLDRPTSGTLTVAGQRLDQMKNAAAAVYRQSTVGMIFQSFNLLPHLTAEQNVMLPAILAGQTRKAAQQRATELFDRVGLKDQRRRTPTELSGGEQQRVAMVRALMNQPKIILADEPTGNLDTATSHDVMKTLLDTISAVQATLIVVTHDLNVAATMERTLTIVDGYLPALPPRP